MFSFGFYTLKNEPMLIVFYISCRINEIWNKYKMFARCFYYSVGKYNHNAFIVVFKCAIFTICDAVIATKRVEPLSQEISICTMRMRNWASNARRWRRHCGFNYLPMCLSYNSHMILADVLQKTKQSCRFKTTHLQHKTVPNRS